jgi:hypothetical protein
METIRVFWKGKFNGRAAKINAQDFDPAVHRLEADGPWPATESPQQRGAGENPDPNNEEGGSSQPQKAKGRPRKTEE